MKDVLTLKFNLNDKPSNGTISKILKEINFTHKKIKLRKKAYYQLELVDERYQFASKIYRLVSLNIKLIFIDETSINQDLFPRKAYWFKGYSLEIQQ